MCLWEDSALLLRRPSAKQNSSGPKQPKISQKMCLAFHGHPGNDDILTPKILASYCLSHKAAGNKLSICSNVSVSLSTNLVFLKHDLQDLGNRGLYKKPCIGNNLNKCLQVLDRHYNQVGLKFNFLI